MKETSADIVDLGAPESVEVGNLDCMSLVPASHYDSEGVK